MRFFDKLFDFVSGKRSKNKQLEEPVVERSESKRLEEPTVEQTQNGKEACAMEFFNNANKSLEEAQTAWGKNIHAVVRLAFRDVIYKEKGYYCIAMKDQVLKLKDCPTLVDVYLYIYHQNEDFRKKINDLYDENWSTTLIIDMVKNPSKYREKMEKVHMQAKQELSLLSKRPSVGKDDFAICPRRSGLLAVVTIEKDLETVRDSEG